MIDAELPDAICRCIQEALPGRSKTTSLHEPLFEGNEWEYLKDCIDSGWVSSVGKYVDRFENALADYTGSRRAVAVVNGTAALHIALLVAGVQRGDEVLLPALSFVATANAVSYLGATPHFVDVEDRTLGLDAKKLGDHLRQILKSTQNGPINRSTGRHVRAIVPMHTYGHPVDLDALLEVSELYGIPIIEDAAESLGSFYKGKHTGTAGLLGAVSFNGNKILTTGGGGAVLTDSDTLADQVKHLTTTAKVSQAGLFDHDQVGYNYRMPNLNAALGCAQLEQLEHFLACKRELAKSYEAAFYNLPDVRFFSEHDFAKCNYWLNTIILAPHHGGALDAILSRAHEFGIAARPCWKLLNSLPMYGSCPHGDLSTSASLEKRIISLPSSVSLFHRVSKI